VNLLLPIASCRTGKLWAFAAERAFIPLRRWDVALAGGRRRGHSVRRIVSEYSMLNPEKLSFPGKANNLLATIVVEAYL
jgi:hypothetical protein